MIVIVLICAGHLAREDCTEATARAVIKSRVESAVCGFPAALATSAAGVASDEYARVRCRGQ
ncbi:MAG: hypothetical protein N2444_00260 [Methylocystis sp.]|nr:hypothetical protein [Methylocystis sp.]